jgi:hypothetical protein
MARSDRAAAWPLAARAQQDGRMRRIGMLINTKADDPVAQTRVGAFLQELQQLDWIIGRNVQIETRWPAGKFSLGVSSRLKHSRAFSLLSSLRQAAQ